MIDEFFRNPSMQRAMLAAFCVAISSAPLGVFLVLRRMSLMGDVMAHAILPGVAAAFIFCGMSLPMMSLGGMVAGLSVAIMAGYVSRVTALREDASLAAFYLIAVAAGVMMIALHGNAQDLEDILFGDAQHLDNAVLSSMAAVGVATIAGLVLIYRTLVMESFDPVFLRSVGGKGGWAQGAFLTLAVLTMVENYRAMGTLMAAGLMLIPAIAAQFWTQRLRVMIAVAIVIALIGAVAGLMISFAAAVPSGPAIILVVGAIYILSLLLGRYGSIRARTFPFRHFKI